MNEPLWVWARLFLRLALVLLAVGLLPLLAAQFLGVDPLIPVMLSLSVAPLGVLCLIGAAILCLAALLRRRRGSS